MLLYFVASSDSSTKNSNRNNLGPRDDDCKALNEAYEEGVRTIKEGQALVDAISRKEAAAKTNDIIMNDETAHLKRPAEITIEALADDLYDDDGL